MLESLNLRKLGRGVAKLGRLAAKRARLTRAGAVAVEESVHAVVERLEGRQMLSVPNMPSGAGATASPTGINVSWNDASWDEQGFVVERRTGAGIYAQVGTVGANGTSFWDAGVSANTTYTYRVTSFNASGSSYPLETNDISTAWLVNGGAAPAAAASIASGAPMAPGYLSATPASANSISLAWASGSAGQEIGFKIDRATWGGAFVTIATVGQGVTSYTDNAYSGGVTGGTQYTYRVRAYNAQGDSGFSNSSAAVTPTGSGAAVIPVYTPSPVASSGTLAAPGYLSATATSATSIALNWASGSAGQEAGFKIDRATWGGAFTTIATVGQGVTSYTDNAYSGGVTASTQYTYRVRAYDAQGDSGYSNNGTASTPSAGGVVAVPVAAPVVAVPAVVPAASGILAAPGYLTASATSANSIALSWASGSAGQEAGFKIDRAIWGGPFTTIATVGQGVTSFTDNTYTGAVAAGIAYTYRVRAYNAQGDSAYSNSSTATTPSAGGTVSTGSVTPAAVRPTLTSSGLPTAPYNLATVAASSTTIQLMKCPRR